MTASTVADASTTNDSSIKRSSITISTGTNASTNASSVALDVLTLLHALAKGLLKGNAARQLCVISIFVVHEEHFRLSWVGGYLDNFSRLGIRPFVQDVDKSLLLGRRH